MTPVDNWIGDVVQPYIFNYIIYLSFATHPFYVALHSLF